MSCRNWCVAGVVLLSSLGTSACFAKDISSVGKQCQNGEPNGQTDHVSELIGELKSPDGNVRWNAAQGLGEIKDHRSVEPLIAALKDADGNVRA